MSKHVLVVGSINVDYVIHTERIPRLGETLTGSNFSMNFGGKGANQAVAIAKAGCEVRMLGAVGRDHAGALALENLRTSGVNADAVGLADAPTGAAVITVCGGDNHILLDIGANAEVTPRVIAESRSLFEWADIVVMQLEIPVESVLAAARLAHELGKTVLLNPAPVKTLDNELYSYIDLMIPNEFEAGLLTGISLTDDAAAAQAIAELRARGCKNAIVTLGGHGCAYGVGEDVHYAGIYKVPRVDTTAAGDSFIGGICAKLCEGKPLDDAVIYAAAVSALTVSRAGAAASIPTADEVERFLLTNTIGEHSF